MKGQIIIKDRLYTFDLSKGIDISIPFMVESIGPNCFFAPLFEANPLQSGNFIGAVEMGSPVNFYNVKLNPHGNGTHTECVGHISKEKVYIKDVCPSSMLLSQVVSIYPTKQENGDRIIELPQIIDLNIQSGVTALIVRTLPNDDSKLDRVYSGNNPPYFEPNSIANLVDRGISHLIVDLPSIDREEDGGHMLGHKAFWNYPATLDKTKTITEMVYVPDHIKDGLYVCAIHAIKFQLDAAPSNIVLYSLNDKI